VVKVASEVLDQNKHMRLIIILFLSFLIVEAKAQQHPFYSADDPIIQKALNVVDPVEYQNFYFQGLKYKILGDNEKALEAFKKCIRLDGGEPSPMYESALIYFESGQLDEALFFIESACEIDKNNKWFQQLLATTYLEIGKYSKAVTAFKKLLELEPGNEDWHFELASAYLMMNQGKNAIKVYDDLEKYIGPYSMLYQQKKRIYMEIGDKPSAIAEIEKWVESEPRNIDALNELAELYLLSGKQEKAISSLEKVLKVNPNDSRAFIILSDLYRNNNQADKSFEYTKKAFASQELNIDTKMRTLLTYYDFTNEDTSLLSQTYELIEALKQAHPKDAKPFTIAGDFYYRDGKIDQAQTNFRKAVELNASRYPIWQQLMIIAFDKKEYEEVIQLGLASQELFPSQPTSYYFSGIAYLQQKKHSSAIDQLNTGKLMVIANDNLLAQFYASLGDAYNAIENYKDSDNSYEKSLELSAENTYVLNNYSYYLSLRQTKLDRAKEMMSLCVKIEPNQPSYEDTYAWVFYQKKEYKDALIWLEKALKNGGDSSATIVEHYGDALFQLNRTEEALEQWIKAKELGSESELIDKKIEDKTLYE